MNIDEKAVAFFLANAGLAYDPKQETREQGQLRCARDLARAEAWMIENEVRAEWKLDEFPDRSMDGGKRYTYYNCLIRHGDLVQSLCGISGATKKYRRVVEAELAAEMLHEIESAMRGWAFVEA